MLSHSCTTANGNEWGAKNCQSGIPSERAFSAPQWARVAQTRLAFLWEFGRKWPEQRISNQIQLSPSSTAFSFWFCFQGVPTCSFQHTSRMGFLPQQELCTLRWDWAIGNAQTVATRPSGCVPWMNWVAETSQPLPRPNWGSCDGSSSLWEHKERHRGGMAQIPGIALASFQRDSGNATTQPPRTLAQNWQGIWDSWGDQARLSSWKIQACSWVEHWACDPICQGSVMCYKVKCSRWKFSAEQRSSFSPVLQVSLGNKGSVKVFQLLIQRSGILKSQEQKDRFSAGGLKTQE